VPAWWAPYAWLGGASNASDVLVEVKGDRIAAVTAGVHHPPAGAIRLGGVMVPGLANTHSHAFHRALRGRTHEQAGSFWSWRGLMYDVADRLDPESYLRLARAAYGEMVVAGFTAVGEFHYLHHGRAGVPYEDPNAMGHALAEAARQAGIRLTLLDACYLRGGLGAPLEGPQLRFGDGNATAWADRVGSLSPGAGVRVGAAIHSVRAVGPDDMAVVAKFAGGSGWPLHAHVSEQRREHDECLAVLGATPLEVMDSADAVGPDFTAVHATHFTAGDTNRLAAAGGFCCACPTTERDLGDGIGPFAALQDAGVRLTVGSDSQAVVDGFEEARAIELDNRLAAEQRGILPGASLLEAATRHGMAALGWDAGRLAPGLLADFVSVRLDTVRTAGADPRLASAVVFAASAADVDTVVVGGRTVVEGGRHVLVPDVAGELAASIGALLP
jgi:formiminoglutamate deiminase